jgi:hypothetical protein
MCLTPPRRGFMLPSMNNVTRVLNALAEGDQQAAGQLLPRVYKDSAKSRGASGWLVFKPS